MTKAVVVTAGLAGRGEPTSDDWSSDIVTRAGENRLEPHAVRIILPASDKRSWDHIQGEGEVG